MVLARVRIPHAVTGDLSNEMIEYYCLTLNSLCFFHSLPNSYHLEK